jgi:nucleoid-associated protein YgaU
VAPGDNLWRIAASVLERSSGQPPSPSAVIPYWRSLIEANRSRLRDPADPGLIFAGQVLALPDTPAA